MAVIRIRSIVVAVVAASLLNLSCVGDETKTSVAKPVAEKAAPAAAASVVVKGATLPVPLPKISDKTFDAKKYGAVGDGAADETAAIQKAIDAAVADGGGKVVIPAGTYLSGPVKLGNYIDLHLDEGATLKALPMDRYPAVNDQYPPLISADKLHDIRLSGSGTINGQGQVWWEKFRANELDLKRPKLIYLSRTDRIEVTGLHMQNSPMFHLVFNNSNDVTIDGLTISAPEESPNTDGIDIRGTNFHITNCTINVGDDNVAIDGPTTKVTITNCKFGVGHGLSIGSYSRDGVSDLLADNITFDGTESGIKGKSQAGRGGLVENLSYSNMKMTGVKNPIYFHSFYDDKNKDPNLDPREPVTELTPIWKNVTITNVTATATTASKRNAGILWGSPEAPIENFTFKNVTLSAQKPFKVYHCKGITFAADVKVTIDQGQERFILFDATDIRLPDGKVKGAPGKKEDVEGKKPEAATK
jgi:polygalacturonase